MSHVALRPAMRYWFYQPYTGHFLSGNLSAALYDVGTEKSYRRGWMAGAGFSYGYAWPLSPRWNFSLEAGIGLYYMQERRGRRSLPATEDERIYRTRRLAFGPSKCEVSFTYLF